MEKIQDAILDTALLGAQLINPIAQEIHCGPPKLVAKLAEQLNARTAVGPPLRILAAELLQPFQDGSFAMLIPEENDPCPWHLFSYI